MADFKSKNIKISVMPSYASLRYNNTTGLFKKQKK